MYNHNDATFEKNTLCTSRVSKVWYTSIDNSRFNFCFFSRQDDRIDSGREDASLTFLYIANWTFLPEDRESFLHLDTMLKK